MKLKNLRLTLANIARTTNSKTLPANSTSKIYGKNEDGTPSDTLEGYAINCTTYRGDNINIKFGTDVAEKIEKLNKELENDVNIEISFTGLKLTPYALKRTDGSVQSGVSGRADDFEIATIENDDLLDI